MEGYPKIFGQQTVLLPLDGKKIVARRIILPMCPSENKRIAVTVTDKYFMTKRYSGKRYHNSTEYNSWLHAAKSLLKKGGLGLYDVPVFVWYHVVFPDSRTVRDAQNREKAFFDAMTGTVYTDDKHVWEHTTVKRVIKGKSFIHAFVFPLRDMPMCRLVLDDEYLQEIAEQIE